MLDIIVKTIDGQNRSYSVPDDYTVKQFKEKISTSMNIPVDRQRLIFQGRELRDVNLLSDFDVNGKTLHLVQRVPPTNIPRANEETSTGNPTSPNLAPGGINVNQAGNLNQDVQQIINQLLGGLGEFGQNATFNASTTGDANGMEVHIDLGNVSQLVNENEIRSRIRNIRRFLTMAQSRLNRIEEIQSGAPLNDTPQHSTIIVGSIETTTINSNDFNTMQTHATAPLPATHHQIIHQTPLTTTQRIVTTSIPFSSLLNNQQLASATNTANTNIAAPSSITTPSTSTNASNTATATTNNPVNSSSETPTQPQQEAPQSISVQVLAELTRSVMDSYARFQPFLQQYHEMLVNDASENAEETPSATTPSTTTATETVESDAVGGGPAATNATVTTNTVNNNDGSSTTTTRTTTTTTTTNTTTSSSATTVPPQAQQQQQQHHPNIVVLGDNRRQRFFNNINDMMHLLGHLFHNLSDLHVNIRDVPPRQIHTMSSMQHSTSAIISAIPIEASINISNFAHHPPPPPPSTTTQPSSTSSSTNTTTTTTTQQQQLPLPPHFSIRPALRGTFPLVGSSLGRGRLLRLNNPTNFNRPPPPPTTTTTPTTASPPIVHTQPQQQFNSNNNSATFTPPPRTPQPQHFHHHHHHHQQAQNQLPHHHHHHHQQQQQPQNPLPHHHHHHPPPPPPHPPLHSPIQRFIRPNLPQMSTLNSYDQFLPCNSVHFYNSANPVIQQHLQATAAAMPQMYSTTQRRRHPAGDQHQSQQQQQQDASTGATATAPLPGNDIHRMLNNIISTTIRNSLGENLADIVPPPPPLLPQQAQAHIHLNIATSRGDSGSNSSPATNTPMSTPVSISPGGVRGGGLGSAGPASFFVSGNSANPPPQVFSQLLSDLLGSTSTTSSEAIPPPLPFNPFNPTDSQLNQPLSELMRLFGASDDDPDLMPPAESTLNIFNVFFQSLRIGDMVDLARGQNRASSFERARAPLRDHLRQTYSIENYERDSERVQTLVDRLYMDIFVLENMGGLNLNLSQLFIMTHQTSIDFPKSFEKLVKSHFRKIIQHILSEEPTSTTTTTTSDTFSLGLFNRLNTFLNELVTLGRVCIGGSALRQTSSAADEQIVQVCVRKLRELLVESSTSNIGAFFGFFETFIQSKLQQILLSINLDRDVIEEYLVYKRNEATAENSNNEDDDQAIDDEQYDSASSTLSGNSVDMDQHFNQYNHPSRPPTSKPVGQNQSVLINERQDRHGFRQETAPTSQSSSWQNSFPSQWLPIIESDMRKMSNPNQNENTTYSDAYVNGMPSKRRKLLFSKNDLLTKNLFKRVLSRTLQKTQLKETASNMSEEQIVNQSLSQSRLIDSFDAEFDTALTERLRHDPEFIEITQKPKAKEKQDDEKGGEEEEDASLYNEDRFQNSKKRLN